MTKIKELRGITSLYKGVDVFENNLFPVKVRIQRTGAIMRPNGKKKYISLHYEYRSGRTMTGNERQILKEQTLKRHGFTSED